MITPARPLPGRVLPEGTAGELRAGRSRAWRRRCSGGGRSCAAPGTSERRPPCSRGPRRRSRAICSSWGSTGGRAGVRGGVPSRPRRAAPPGPLRPGRGAERLVALDGGPQRLGQLRPPTRRAHRPSAPGSAPRAPAPRPPHRLGPPLIGGEGGRSGVARPARTDASMRAGVRKSAMKGVGEGARARHRGAEGRQGLLGPAQPELEQPERPGPEGRAAAPIRARVRAPSSRPRTLGTRPRGPARLRRARPPRAGRPSPGHLARQPQPLACGDSRRREAAEVLRDARAPSSSAPMAARSAPHEHGAIVPQDAAAEPRAIVGR